VGVYLSKTSAPREFDSLRAAQTCSGSQPCHVLYSVLTFGAMMLSVVAKLSLFFRAGYDPGKIKTPRDLDMCAYAAAFH